MKFCEKKVDFLNFLPSHLINSHSKRTEKSLDFSNPRDIY